MSQRLALIHNPASTSSLPLSSFVTRERQFSTRPIIWKRPSNCATASPSWTKGRSSHQELWNSYWQCVIRSAKCNDLMACKSCSSSSLEKHYATNCLREIFPDSKEGEHT